MYLTPHQAQFFAYELTSRHPSGDIEALSASLSEAKVDLNPHQVDAALFAFKSPLSQGAILADEVGLGKTIEAGIVIAQKWAERKRKLLIVVPANLRKQWAQELSDKFYLPTLLLESKSFNLEIKNRNFNPFHQSDKIIICSYQFARKQRTYVDSIEWDLVVIDEAHRLRNVYKASNRIARDLRDSLRRYHKILLTATPLQNTLLELYGLVSFIDEYIFGEVNSFKESFARIGTVHDYTSLQQRLAPVCKRTLRRQVKEYVPYTDRHCIVEDFFPTDEEQLLYDDVTDYLRRDVLYALPASQRQLVTLILRKLLASSTHAITGTFGALADKLQAVIDRHDAAFELPEVLIADNYETYENQRDEWADEEEEGATKEKPEVWYTAEELEALTQEMNDLRTFEALSRSIQQNSKGEKLHIALEKGFDKLKELGAPRKAIIFTESTRTQNYLREILIERGHDPAEIVLFNGSNTDAHSKKVYRDWLVRYQNTDRVTGSPTADTRAALVDYFRETATFMIATEAAAEGVNLQFCALVVNYDLPWNPQRIEQRIGRCHRYGQRFDVVVVNFINLKNAADKRVYDLLSEKFQLFEGVFGASDEVLGAIESGVDFEKRIAAIYQNCRDEAEIKAAFDQLQDELDDSISENYRQARQKLLDNFDQEVLEKLKMNSKYALDNFQEKLWQLTRFMLEEVATFDDHSHAFILNQLPLNGQVKEVKTGRYVFDKNATDAYVYRIGHPLAQALVEGAKRLTLPAVELVFDLSQSGQKVAVLESLSEASGWLDVQLLTLNTLETTDHLVAVGFTDDGIVLEKEQTARLLTLPARVQGRLQEAPPDSVRDLLDRLHDERVEIIKDERKTVNSKAFNDEIDKMERWANDARTALRRDLDSLEADIRLRKTEARRLIDLEGKVKAQRFIKELERRLADKRYRLYELEQEIENRKDQILDQTQARLKQRTSARALFTVRWRLT